jgi:predicted flap endonuclease-1-like 5' DNA nuclease
VRDEAKTSLNYQTSKTETENDKAKEKPNDTQQETEQENPKGAKKMADNLTSLRGACNNARNQLPENPGVHRGASER